MKELPEQDWRYLGSIKGQMLEELSRRINDEVRRALGNRKLSENEKRRKVYQVVRDRDRITAECFNDWRRSRFLETCCALRRHRLLAQEHLDRLTPDTRNAILFFETLSSRA